LEDLESAKQARFIIINQSNNIALGAVDLFAMDFDSETASVGILIADSVFRNKGVGAEALRCLEDVCTDDLGIFNLKARVHETNFASIRLFEKVNYSKKKLTQDAHLKNADYIESLIFEKCLKK
jgi:RimJ/RimL family protein N-acetyltransferase